MSLSRVFFHFFCQKNTLISWFVLLIFFVFSRQNVCQPSSLTFMVCVKNIRLSCSYLYASRNLVSIIHIFMSQEYSSQRPLFLCIWNTCLSDVYFYVPEKLVSGTVILCVIKTCLSDHYFMRQEYSIFSLCQKLVSLIAICCRLEDSPQ